MVILHYVLITLQKTFHSANAYFSGKPQEVCMQMCIAVTPNIELDIL